MAAVRAVIARWGRSSLTVLVLALVAVEIVFSGPYVARSAGQLAHLHWEWVGIAVAAALGSMLALAGEQRRLLAAGGTRIPLRRMVSIVYASNAVSGTIPGGTALSAGYSFRRMRRWGATGAQAGFAVAASGLVSLASFGLLGLVGLLLLGDDSVNPMITLGGVLTLAAAGVVSVLLVRRQRAVQHAAVGVTGAIMRLLRRPFSQLPRRLERFIGELRSIRPRWRDWAMAMLYACVNWVADMLCLYAALRAVGIEPNLALVALSYFVGMGVSNLTILPSGLGVRDAAMVATLVNGGLGLVPATAAVITYRLVSFGLVVAAGWAVWLNSWVREGLGRTAGDTENAEAAGDSGGAGAGGIRTPPTALTQ